MGRPRIGENLKKPSDYSYDYPEQREIAKMLLANDRRMIAEATGYSTGYIGDWCLGIRKNARIMELALPLAEINKQTILKKEKVTIQ